VPTTPTQQMSLIEEGLVSGNQASTGRSKETGFEKFCIFDAAEGGTREDRRSLKPGRKAGQQRQPEKTLPQGQACHRDLAGVQAGARQAGKADPESRAQAPSWGLGCRPREGRRESHGEAGLSSFAEPDV